MTSSRLFSGSKTRSCSLETLYRRLDALVDWERCRRATSDKKLMRVSAQPARDLLKRLGDPQKSFSAVHITGSKGKGSVAALIAEGLRRAPFVNAPVGTYGSPHVERVNERIRINGTPIEDDLLQRALGDSLHAMETPTLLQDTTWFDAISATGFVAFRYSGVKWGVVEVGMGGRLDSTNVVAAPVSVVTNIHLEHANVIGPTLKDIAYEKAGIIAPSAQVVCGVPEAHELGSVFRAEARSVTPAATVHFCGAARNASILEQNVALARRALELVARVEGDDDASGEMLLPGEVAVTALARLPARQEQFVVEVEGGDCVTAVLDGAHTAESVDQVLREARAERRRPVVVLGMNADKDCEAICRAVGAHALHVFATVAGSGEMYERADKLGATLQKLGTRSSVVENAEHALREALRTASSEGTQVVIIGSLHLAGRLRAVLGQVESEHRLEDKRSATR